MNLNRRSAIMAMLALGGCQTVATVPAMTTRRSFALGLQLYTLGDAPQKDLAGTLAKVAMMGYTDIELPGLMGHSAAEVRAAADAHNLKISSIHVMPSPLGPGPALTLQSGYTAVADAAHILGASHVVMPLMVLPDMAGFTGDNFAETLTKGLSAAGADIWKRTADVLNDAGAAMAQSGLSFAYHNHNMEFAPIGDMTGWDILVFSTNPAHVSFELDVGWVSAAGLDPAAMIRLLGPRVVQLHMKDVLPTTRANFALSMDPTQVGQGRIDWAGVLDAARTAGVRHCYVEQEPPFAIDRFDAIAQSAAFLKPML